MRLVEVQAIAENEGFTLGVELVGYPKNINKRTNRFFANINISGTNCHLHTVRYDPTHPLHF